jgi:hypothetical protein
MYLFVQLGYLAKANSQSVFVLSAANYFAGSAARLRDRLRRSYLSTNGMTNMNKKPAIKHDHSKEPRLRKGFPFLRSNSRRRQGSRKSTGPRPSGYFRWLTLINEPTTLIAIKPTMSAKRPRFEVPLPLLPLDNPGDAFIPRRSRPCTPTNGHQLSDLTLFRKALGVHKKIVGSLLRKWIVWMAVITSLNLEVRKHGQIMVPCLGEKFHDDSSCSVADSARPERAARRT